MAEQKNQQAQPELSLSEQTRIRREKLATLQAEGENPFAVTRFDWDATSQQIKDNFDAMEGKAVKVAGRLMSKRGMGKVSFCDLQDRDGRIQLYARQDEMDEAVYKKFKKYDIGDIVGVEGEVFRTQRGEMSVRAKNVILLSKSLLPLPEKFHGLHGQGAALPPALCGSDGEPGGQAELCHPLPVHQAPAGLSGQHGLHRGGDPGARTPSPAALLPVPLSPTTTRWTSICICASPRSCP